VDGCSVAGLLEVYIAFKIGLLNQCSYVYGIVILYCSNLLHFSISVHSFFTVSRATKSSVIFIKSLASPDTTTSNRVMGREENGRWESVKNLAGKMFHPTDWWKQDG
jgi:hypothetical protein